MTGEGWELPDFEGLAAAAFAQSAAPPPAVSWDALRATMDQVAAHHRDRPPVERVTAHDRATLVHLLDEAFVRVASDDPLRVHVLDDPALGASPWMFGIPVFFDVDVPPDRVRVRHVDGRVFDHHTDGRVVRVVDEERTDG